MYQRIITLSLDKCSYKITQIMDDLCKPECVIYGEYRELFSITDEATDTYRVANVLGKASTEGLLCFHWLPPVK